MAADLNELRRWHANKAERQIELAANVKAATAGEVHRKRAELQRQAEFHLNAVRVIDADSRQVDDASYELGRLLNHIHGDHGQTVALHGWKKAATDALAKVSASGVTAAPAPEPLCPFCGERHGHCDSPGAIVTGTTGCDTIDVPARARLAAHGVKASGGETK